MTRRNSPTAEVTEVLEEARPLLSDALDFLESFYRSVPEDDLLFRGTSRAKRLSALPHVENLLTPEGYSAFWETNKDSMTRHRVYLAVTATRLPYLEEFKGPLRGVGPMPPPSAAFLKKLDAA
jgi:hypothetical protein